MGIPPVLPPPSPSVTAPPAANAITPIAGPPTAVPLQTQPLAPRAVQRAKAPDISGFYEQVPVDEGKQSAFTMQVHQVGSVIVGWFSPPPAFVTMDWRTLSRPENENDFAVPFGIFVAITGASTNGPFTVVWSRTSDGFPFNTADPSDIVSTTSAVANFAKGELAVVTASPSTFNEILFKFDAGSSSAERLARVKEGARWPMNDIAFFSPEVRDALIAEQVRPIPTTFMSLLQGSVAPTGDPSTQPPIGAAIAQWQRTPDGDKSAREVARTKVFNELTLVDSAIKQASLLGHRRAIVGALTSHAASQILTVDGDTRTYLRWLQAVLRDEIDRRAAAPPDPGIHEIEERFRRLGFDPGDRYVYTVTFFELNDALALFLRADIGKLFSNLRAVKSAKRFGTSISAHLLVATIEKESVTYELVNGYPKCDRDGHGIIKSRTRIPNWGGSSVPLFGFFGDAGVGLGWDSKLLDPDLKTKTLGPAGASGVYELASAQDFAFDAFRAFFFRVIAIKGPAVAVGNYAGFNAFSSVFFQADLLSANATLTTDRTTRLAFDPPHVPNVKDLTSAKKQFKKWFEASVDVTLASLSGGFGYVWRADSPLGGRQDTQTNENTPPVSSAITDKFQAFFKADSDNIDEATSLQLIGGVTPTVRDLIEIAVAEHLLLFTSPNAEIMITGYASPEYRSAEGTVARRKEAARKYNLALSQRRAVAVQQALFDSFGIGRLAVKSIACKGAGDAPAYAAHLKDPNDSPLPLNKWMEDNPDEVERWPEFRRVDVLVNDRELFSVGG